LEGERVPTQIWMVVGGEAGGEDEEGEEEGGEKGVEGRRT
jgi:hypothetical protein